MDCSRFHFFFTPRPHWSNNSIAFSCHVVKGFWFVPLGIETTRTFLYNVHERIPQTSFSECSIILYTNLSFLNAAKWMAFKGSWLIIGFSESKVLFHLDNIIQVLFLGFTGVPLNSKLSSQCFSIVSYIDVQHALKDEMLISFLNRKAYLTLIYLELKILPHRTRVSVIRREILLYYVLVFRST